MQRPFDSAPAQPVVVSISEEPALAPIAVSFDSEPPARPGRVPGPAAAGRRASPLRRVVAWCVDLSLLAALFAAHVFVAVRLAGAPQAWLDLLLASPLWWAALLGCLAVAWSWMFVALWARTPGMAMTGQRLRSLRGGAPDPVTALARAALALLFAVPALFGFVLALFDRRGQTLHDKLCRCAAVVD